MKSFTFSKPIPNRQDAFLFDLSSFLAFMQEYYTSQIDQVSKKVAHSEKIRNNILSNFKDQPDFSRLAVKQDPKKAAEKQGPPDVEEQILNKIDEAQMVLKQIEEDQKPKKPGVSKQPVTKPGENQKAGVAGKKPEPVKTGIMGRGPILPPKLDAQKKADGTGSRLGGIGVARNKNTVEQPKAGSNWAKHTGTQIKEKEKEVVAPTQVKEKEVVSNTKPVTVVKEEVKVNEIRPQTQLERKKEEAVEKKEESRPKIHRFQIQEAEVVKKEQIVEFLDAKKGVKKKFHELKENMNYYKEREKKTKLRFMSKLTAHLNSAEAVFAREYQEVENGEHQREEAEKPIEFETLNLAEQDIPYEDSETVKTLHIARNVLASLKTEMDLNNEEFRNIVECRAVFQDEEKNYDHLDKALKLMRSWYLMDSINKKVRFVKKELVRYLEECGIEDIMRAANGMWNGMNYFVPLEGKKEAENQGTNIVHISWMNCALKENADAQEIVCSKSGLKGSKKAVKEQGASDNALQIEFLNMEISLKRTILNYLTRMYGINSEKGMIENVKGKNLGDLMKLLRMISILTSGNCLRFTLFMFESEL